MPDYEAILRRILPDNPHTGEDAECIFCDGGGIGCDHHRRDCPWLEGARALGLTIPTCPPHIHRGATVPDSLVDGSSPV